MNGFIMNANTIHRKQAQVAWGGMWLAAAMVTTGLALGVAALIISEGDISLPPHQYFNPVITVTFGLMGALIASRHPRNTIGWIFSGIALMSGLNLLGLGYGKLGDAGVALPALDVAHWLDRWIWIPATVLPLTLVLLLFPDGKVLSRRWRVVTWAVGAGLAGVLLAIAFHPNLDEAMGYNSPNPYGLHGTETIFEAVMYSGFALLFVGFVGSVVGLVVRYRRSEGLRREQMKWLVYACGLLVAGMVIQGFLPVVITNEDVASEAGIIISGMTTVVIALAAAAAIVKHRLYNIDLIINRTLVYGTMSVVLGLMFVSSVFLLQKMFASVTGGQQSPVALGVSTLVIGGLFQPSRTRLQRFVDRKFYGIQIDYGTARTRPMLPQSNGRLSGGSVGVYSKLETIGQGGMAEVYKAHHPSLNRAVAVKVMNPSITSDESYRKRFEREAQVVAGLKHPNIVQMFDFGEDDGRYFMVMEYVGGADLADMLKGLNEPLPLERVRTIVNDVAGALDYAHQAGLVHRDVKPSNVMLEPVTVVNPGDASERAVLMDFGIARIAGGRTQLTGADGLLGTLDYIAPEQIQASSEVDKRADVYSLGVMVFQMVTGQLPFVSNHPSGVLLAHLQQVPPDPRKLRPDLPATVSEAILQSLAKNPRERLSSCGQLAAALSVIERLPA